VRLIAERDPESIKRYGHVRRARFWSRGCDARLEGTTRHCTRERGHKGPHLAHGIFGRVLAVWDEVHAVPRPHAKVPTRARPARRGSGRGGPIEALKAFGSRVVRRPHQFMEEAFLLVLVLAMVGFVIDWALRILGAR